MKKLLISLLSLHGLLAATDDDRASSDNANSAKEANESGAGKGVDCGSCDWQSRDRDNNLPDNESSCNEGLHTPSWDRKD